MKKINNETIKNIIKSTFVFIFDTIKTIMRIVSMLVRRISICIIDICDDLYYLIFDYEDELDL